MRRLRLRQGTLPGDFKLGQKTQFGNLVGIEHRHLAMNLRRNGVPARLGTLKLFGCAPEQIIQFAFRHGTSPPDSLNVEFKSASFCVGP